NKQGNREFGIVAGHRRVAAGRAAGLRGVEGAISREGEDHAVITIIENMGKRSLSSFEKGIALYTLQQQRGISIREVAEATGNAKTYVGELMQALQAPGALREIWEEDEISPRAIVQLKKHWGLFEKEEVAPLLKKMRGLSQKQASELNVQLNAGTDLKSALAVINSTGNGRELSENKSPGKKPNRARAGAVPKKELITAIGDVFPGLKKTQIGTLFDFAEHIGIKDTDVLWAAALYVDRGGKVNQAVAQSAAAMADRSLKGLLNREIKLTKQVASYLNTQTKEDKTMGEYLQVIFSSRS
ncbi:MAG: ParB/RepB/Spo0J family partition protein, partial [Anaerolineales bacterium]|nr:ParB/RepB/Spo0J family partition protein [Anaerolineales bacterium]